MKKVILVIFCTAILMSGCSSNTADTVSNDVQQVNVSYDQMDNEGIGWGFVRKKGAPPEIPNSQKEVLRKYDCYYIDENAPKTLYLTFDEGYENGCTGKILDILKEKKVTATFYVTLDYVKSSPELVQRMINEGHEVGNHSCTHPSLPDTSDDMVFEEIQGLETYISDNFGGYKTVTMRPPRGEFSVRTLRIAKNMGYDTVLWSFAYNDWNTDAQPDRDTAYRRITSATHNGAVYLLHAVSETNTAILPDVIDYWLDNGYTVKSISG